MKNKKIIFLVVILIIIVLIIIKYWRNNNNIEHGNVETLKKDVGITGDNELYQVQTEYDGKKILDIKPEIQYKVAFAGIIEQGKPKIENVDAIFNNNYPEDYGIWIENNSRDKILQILNRNLNNEYEINKNGYLDIKKEDNLTDIDKELKKMIGAKKKYIITISEVYYGVDRVSGEILDNFYEDMDPYQATKIVDYGDNIIIFVTTNKEQKLTDKEILQELISYM